MEKTESTPNNINVDELKKLSNKISIEQNAPENPMSQQIMKNDCKKIGPTIKNCSAPRRVSPPTNTQTSSSEPDTINIENGNDDNVSQIIDTGGTTFDGYTFFGFAIPKQTFYFILIIIFLTIAIWYLTSGSTRKKLRKDEHDNNDEK